MSGEHKANTHRSGCMEGTHYHLYRLPAIASSEKKDVGTLANSSSYFAIEVDRLDYLTVAHRPLSN